MSDETLPGLDAGTAASTSPTGQVQAQVEAAVQAAQLDSRDGGMGALAVSCARAVDLAHGRRDPYAVATTARELRETLIRLRLDPTSRMGADAGGVEKWLAGLGASED